MATGDSAKGSIKEIKIKRQFGDGEGGGNQKGLGRTLVSFLVKGGAIGEF